MSQQDDFRRLVELGKATVNQGAVVARHVARSVSAEAIRQADIARPKVREASQKAWGEIQRQAVAVKPVVQDVTKRAAAATSQGIRHAVPLICHLNRKLPWAGKASLGCAAGLFGLILLGGFQSGPSDGGPTAGDTAEVVSNPFDFETAFQQVAESSVEEQFEEQPATEMEAPIEEPDEEEVAGTQFGDAFEQWRHQPPPTTAEYEGSMSQYNAQAAPNRGFSPEQMGRFAAAGYRPHLQPQRYPR